VGELRGFFQRKAFQHSERKMGYEVPVKGLDVPLNLMGVEPLHQGYGIQSCALLGEKMKFFSPGIGQAVPSGHHPHSLGVGHYQVGYPIEVAKLLSPFLRHP